MAATRARTRIRGRAGLTLLIVCGVLVPLSAPAQAQAQAQVHAQVQAQTHAQTPKGPDVTELDLSGVDKAALAALPAPGSVPSVEDDASAVDAPAAEGSATTEDAPAATAPRQQLFRAAEPSVGPTDEPTEAAPTDQPTGEPTGGPTATPTATATTPSPTPSVAPSVSPSVWPTATPSSTPTTAPTTEPVPVPDVLTPELSTDPFSVFGVTWDQAQGLEDVTIRYRVRTDGTWSNWEGLSASDVAPDPGTPDARSGSSRDGTDPVVAVGADGIQVWADAADGTVRDLKAVLVDPGPAAEAAGAAASRATSTAATRASDRTAAAPAASLAAATATAPGIISRAGWGADESLRTCTPDFSTKFVSAAVHHTASANGYSAEAVPGIIQGFYAYHTRSEANGGRGWCDIGYNFLVDRFGRIWEGRAGGITSTVVGVHTGGFNSRTIGVAAIGNLAEQAPSAEMVEGISQLVAWKFAVHGILAGTDVSMVSGGGASKYPAGTTVVFPTIYGHRDAQLTACPGQYLYDLLPAIRGRVAGIANASVIASPHGSVDSIRGTSSGISVGGWAFDPNSGSALRVDVSVDGAVTSTTASTSRPDVAAAFGVGPNHGFVATVAAGGGQHLVCLTAANVGSGADIVLGCGLVTVSNATPVGSLDVVRATTGGVAVGGWALDPDTKDSLDVHVYVDGKATVVRANGSRPDVGAAYHLGDNHGFDAVVATGQGDHTVCVYMINRPAGVNPLLGCRSVKVGATPVGSLDMVRSTGTGVAVGGWALDPDTTASIDVHVYVDGRATVVRANRTRTDVGAAYHLGNKHGFDAVVATADGTHQVCVYMINKPAGVNPLLGCRTVTVGATPVGSLDMVRSTGSGVAVGGWALDPDTTASIDVHVYVDGAATVVRANRPRADVGALYRLGNAHGFDAVVGAVPGQHRVCVYMINAPRGVNPLLGCRDVQV